MTKYTEFVTIFSSLQVGIFRISLFIPNGICSNKVFLLSVWVTGTMYMNVDQKQSSNVLENQTRLQNSTDTTRKSLIFRVLCALFEKNSIRYKSRYSKKILPEAELKIVTNYVHLVIWSRGFPTVKKPLNSI